MLDDPPQVENIKNYLLFLDSSVNWGDRTNFCPEYEGIWELHY